MRYADKKRIHDLLGPLILTSLLITFVSRDVCLSRLNGGIALALWTLRQWTWRSMRQHYSPLEANLSFSENHLYHWFVVSWLLFLTAIFTPAFVRIFGLLPPTYDFRHFWFGIGAFILGHTILAASRLSIEKREEQRARKALKKTLKKMAAEHSLSNEQKFSFEKNLRPQKSASKAKRY